MSKAEGVTSLKEQISEHFGRAQPAPKDEEIAAPDDELDTDEGTPNKARDLAAEKADDAPDDDTESDTDDDGTPDDDESSEGGEFEQRFKDTQAKLTETSQELSRLRDEYSQNVGQITDARLDLEERLSEVENEIGFWEQLAQEELQGLHNVNVQQLSQDEYMKWQQAVNTAGSRMQGIQARKQQFSQYAQRARESAIGREVKIARAVLTNSIDSFDEVYPEIGQYAVEQGVNPKVFNEITDPGLIRILYRAMSASRQPDVVKETARKIQTNKRPPSNTRRGQVSRPKSLAERMYGSK